MKCYPYESKLECALDHYVFPVVGLVLAICIFGLICFLAIMVWRD